MIETANSSCELWVELTVAFENCVETNNEELIKKILNYATWCTSEEAGDISNETHQAVYCGFMESITYNRKYFPLFKKMVQSDAI